MTIGQKIKHYRELKGMSQEELAIACGYKGRSSISRIEKDEGDIPQSKIKQIANVLEVSPGALIGDVSVSVTASVPLNDVSHGDLVKLLMKFDAHDVSVLSRLTPQEIARLIGYAEAMIEGRK